MTAVAIAALVIAAAAVIAVLVIFPARESSQFLSAENSLPITGISSMPEVISRTTGNCFPIPTAGRLLRTVMTAGTGYRSLIL